MKIYLINTAISHHQVKNIFMHWNLLLYSKVRINYINSVIDKFKKELLDYESFNGSLKCVKNVIMTIECVLKEISKSRTNLKCIVKWMKILNICI